MQLAPAGLGSSWDDLLKTITSSAESDITAWLFAQYAALHALPRRIAALQGAQQTLLGKIPPSMPAAEETRMQVVNAGTKLADLSRSYPEMIGGIDAAYQRAQVLASGGAGGAAVITDAATVAESIYGAQAFLSGVSDVDNSLKTVVDTLLANGAITPQEAQNIYAESQGSGTGWGKYVGYAVIGLVGFWLLKKVF